MYTFKPKEKFAKAHGENMRISTRKAQFICKTIRGKKLTAVKRLLQDLAEERRDLDGKYYSKTVKNILMMVESCEKNADFLGLDTDKLFVHASAHQGATLRRRRRKSGFGSRMKATNLEVMLIEKGKLTEKSKVSAKVHAVKKKTDVEKQIDSENAEMKNEIKEMKEKSEKIKEKVEEEQ